jgi:parallel beta-helix repeat protein
MFKIQRSLQGLLLIAIVTMFSVLLLTPVRAATMYYVATNGNDSNPGTQNLPFATLSKAIEKVAAGDTVNVRGGIYYLKQGLWIGNEKTGTESERIVFQSYPGEKAIIDGSNMPKKDPNDRNASQGQDAFAIAGRYIDIKGFEIRQTTRIGINVWGGSNIRLQNNVIHDIRGAGIYMGYSDPSKVTDIIVEGNQVYNTCLVNNPPSESGGWPSAISASGNGNIRITNNKVYNNYGEGIAFGSGSGALISGNTVYDNFSAEIYLLNATNSTVANNLLYTTNDSRFYRFNQPSPSIQLANESEANKLDNNQIINNIALGGREGISYYSSYGYGGGLRNTVIANNTFYKATGTLLLIQKDAGHTNTLIANNIFYQTGGGAMTNLTANSGLRFDHNLWYGGSAGAAAGTGDVNADPKLLNPGTTTDVDYKLQAGSPAIDAGAQLIKSVPNDYAGSSRPLGKRYDIGAYEYVQ